MVLGTLLVSSSSSYSKSSYKECGIASWYGPGFNGKKTASGQKFNQNSMTAAHKRLPFGTRLKVKNMKTSKYVNVIVNDRGPFIKGRVIDLSKGAAKKLGILQTGSSKVCLYIN